MLCNSNAEITFEIPALLWKSLIELFSLRYAHQDWRNQHNPVIQFLRRDKLNSNVYDAKDHICISSTVYIVSLLTVSVKINYWHDMNETGNSCTKECSILNRNEVNFLQSMKRRKWLLAQDQEWNLSAQKELDFDLGRCAHLKHKTLLWQGPAQLWFNASCSLASKPESEISNSNKKRK